MLVADFRGIEGQLDDFGVAGSVGAHVFVGGIVELAAFVADGGLNDAGNLPETDFHSPETTCSKCCFFHENLRVRPLRIPEFSFYRYRLDGVDLHFEPELLAGFAT